MWAGNLYQNSWWPWWAQTEAEALQRTRRHIEHVCTAGANGPRISCRFVVGCVRRVVHIHMKIQMSVVSVMERLWVTVGPAKIEKFHSEFETVSKSFSLSGHQRLGFGLFGFGYASLGLKSVGCNWTQRHRTWLGTSYLPKKKRQTRPNLRAVSGTTVPMGMAGRCNRNSCLAFPFDFHIFVRCVSKHWVGAAAAASVIS